MNYIYRIEVKPSAYGTGWDVLAHHADGVTRLTNYAFRTTATRAARKMAKQRLAKQGSNLRLEVAVFDRQRRITQISKYGVDPRARS